MALFHHCLQYINDGLAGNFISRRILLRIIEYMDAIAPEHTQTARKCGVCSEFPLAYHWNSKDRQPHPGEFTEQAKCQRITDTQCPFIDRVEGRGKDDDGIGRRQYIGVFWPLIIAAHWMPCQLYEVFLVHKTCSIGRQDATHIPVSGLKESNK